MKIFIPLVLTIALVWVLDHPIGSLPALGRLLDPVNGWAANAEPANKDFNALSSIKGLNAPVTVWLEDRMVPHIQASNDHDLYFAEGYVHAFFRLWQMDMQTRAAAGRVSEVIGEKSLKFDRTQRRKGMVFAAENSLKAMEATPQTKLMLDAYTAGVNAYIHSLKDRDLPLEYKLLGFVPEEWTNIKCALLMKYMADDLTGYTEDFPLTYLRDRLTPGELDYLYPEKIKGSKPVIPAGTRFEKPSLKMAEVPAGNLFVHFNDGKVTSNDAKKDSRQFASNLNADNPVMEDEDHYERDGIGSNNWAISGSRTASGSSILCNDPHLGLNLPSLWFEVQMQAPGLNSYGVSLPGAPGIVIGFNDSLSWGFTNNYRDVKDFYLIDAANNNTYRFNGKEVAFKKRVEVIKVKGAKDLVDTVLYTVHGPVMYDEHFIDPAKTGNKIAMCWMAHRSTNELLALYQLNRAKNYNEFVRAIMSFQCPAQNMVYADRNGNIAMWGQGQFINKWKEQGKYVMEGYDNRTLWGENIPMNENPHVLNPPQGYVASANQSVTDDTYPYWYNGHFLEFRSWRINEVLPASLDVKTAMGNEKIQNDVISVLANNVSKQLDLLASDHFNWDGNGWDGALNPDSGIATNFQVIWSILYANIWKDDFNNVPERLWPTAEVTMQMLLSDSTMKYYDDRTTPEIENRRDIVKRSYKQALDSIDRLKQTVGVEWYKVKNTSIKHLTKLPAFSYDYLKIGGWGNTINAVKKDHGPSWRMVVEMGKDKINAFGVYPGGQSGNPGSKNYANFINNWVNGKYYSILFLSNAKEQNDQSLKYKWTMTN